MVPALTRMRPTPPEDVTLAAILTAYSPSSHRTGLEADERAGFTEAWCFHLAWMWCYLSINLQTHGDQSSPCFISHQTGRAAATLCLRGLYSSIHRPTSRVLRRRYGDMVEAAVGICQLYTARRILAEIQHRINGFNTYG